MGGSTVVGVERAMVYSMAHMSAKPLSLNASRTRLVQTVAEECCGLRTLCGLLFG